MLKTNLLNGEEVISRLNENMIYFKYWMHNGCSKERLKELEDRERKNNIDMYNCVICSDFLVHILMRHTMGEPYKTKNGYYRFADEVDSFTDFLIGTRKIPRRTSLFRAMLVKIFFFFVRRDI